MIQPRLEIDFSPSKRGKFIRANNEYSPNFNEFLFNHNRSALQFILEFLNIKGSHVAVLAYNCHTVMNAVHQAGCIPIFIDINRTLQMDIDDLNKKNEKNHFSAVIVTHLFGIYNDIDSIRSIVNVPVIEDCAHAYMSPNCGEKGDFAVYSIGQGKFPSIGDGGICKINNPAHLEDFRKLYSAIPDYSYSERLLLYLKLYIKHICYKPFIYSLLRHCKNNKPNNIKESAIIKKMNKGISTLFNDCQHELTCKRAERQKKAEYIIDEIKDLEVSPLINPIETNCIMLPLNCNCVPSIQDYFRMKGIETATHFAKCIEWAKDFGYKEGECPNAEYFTKHLLVVPTYR